MVLIEAFSFGVLYIFATVAFRKVVFFPHSCFPFSCTQVWEKRVKKEWKKREGGGEIDRVWVWKAIIVLLLRFFLPSPLAPFKLERRSFCPFLPQEDMNTQTHKHTCLRYIPIHKEKKSVFAREDFSNLFLTAPSYSYWGEGNHVCEMKRKSEKRKKGGIYRTRDRRIKGDETLITPDPPSSSSLPFPNSCVWQQRRRRFRPQ